MRIVCDTPVLVLPQFTYFKCLSIINNEGEV
jgi:hypothetical protein